MDKPKKIRLTLEDYGDIVKQIAEAVKNGKGIDLGNVQKKAEESAAFDRAEVQITKNACDKMWLLVDAFGTEVSWNATAKRIDENKFLVEDVMICPQTVTGATVTTDDDEYREWLDSLSDDEFNNMRFHGHSHVNMGVTPSGVDTRYRAELVSQLPNSEDDNNFYIFMILNKSRCCNCEIFDIAKNTYYPNDAVDVVRLVPKALNTFLKEAREKVKEQFFPSPKKTKAQSAFEKAKDYPFSDYDEYNGWDGLHPFYD